MSDDPYKAPQVEDTVTKQGHSTGAWLAMSARLVFVVVMTYILGLKITPFLIAFLIIIWILKRNRKRTG